MRTTWQTKSIKEMKSWPIEKLATLTDNELITIINNDTKKQLSLGEYFYKNGDNSRSIFWYKEAAAKGNLMAQYTLSLLLTRGKESEKNESEAFAWCHRAATNGFLFAQCLLGELYLTGTGTKKDPEEAVEWFKRAARRGNANAQYHLARCLQRGIGVAINETEATNWFKEAAQAGDTESQYRLAERLMKGQGIKKNENEAAAWLNQAAKKDHLCAQKWVDNQIGFVPDFILKHAEDCNECYIPYEHPPAFSNFGPYCGLAAFAAAINYSECLPYPLYATAYEKKLAGKWETMHQTHDILLHQLKYDMLVKEKWQTEEGEMYNVQLFAQLAKHYHIDDCEIILNQHYTQDEYEAILINKLKENKVLIVACESENEMPANNHGKSTHWVMVPAYWYDKNNVPYVNAMHHGLYAKWPVDALFKSNQQMPLENPLKAHGHLKKFRYSIFAVPVIAQRKMIIKPQEENSLLNLDNVTNDSIFPITDEVTDKQQLEAFKKTYDEKYESEFFSNPFSKMKQLKNEFTSMKQVYAYAKENPTSRTITVLDAMKKKGII